MRHKILIKFPIFETRRNTHRKRLKKSKG